MSIHPDVRARGRRFIMTRQRQSILEALEASTDHPDALTLCGRAQRLDPSISISTIYRTLNTFVAMGLVVRHDFEAGKGARFEIARESGHHDHLIDVASGEVVEFHDERLEALTREIAERLGYKLTNRKLQLFGAPNKMAPE